MSPERTEGRLLFDIGERQWDIPRLRELLEQVVPLHTTFEDFEVAPRLSGGRPADDAAQRPARRGWGWARKPHPPRDRGCDRTAASGSRAGGAAFHRRAREPRRKDSAISCSASRRSPTCALLKLSFDDLLREILERVRKTLEGETAVILLRHTA